MTRLRRRTRALARVVLLFVVGFGLAAAMVLFFGRDDFDTATVRGDAVSVDQLVVVPSAEPADVVVTGYVFVGSRQSILCSARNHDDPPYCEGSSVIIDRLDTSRLDLVTPDGAPAYSRDEVTLAGRYGFGTLTVREILQSP